MTQTTSFSFPGRGQRRPGVVAFRLPVVCAGLAAAVTVLLTAGVAPAAAASAGKLKLPPAPAQRLVPSSLAAAGTAPAAPSYSHYNPLVDSTLPAAGSGIAALPAAGSSLSAAQVPAGVLAANPGARQAGSLPVLVGPATAAGAASVAGAAPLAGPAPSAVSVTLTSQQTALAAGVHGILFSVGAAAGSAGSGPVEVSVDDSSFVAAYGGDYAARLHLVEMPACALTTPAKPACQTEIPLAALAGAPLTAQVSLPAAGTTAGSQVGLSVVGGTTSVAGSSVVLAATSGTGGSSGTYAASTLSPAGTWAESGNTGAFTYSYPLTVPAAIGGATPSVSLDYNSSAQDGFTEGTNNQGSWVGDGWDTSTGNYIERTYETCTDDSSNGAPQYSGDQCWDGQILTMSLDGQSTQIVYDDATHTFRPVSDSSGVKIVNLTTCDNGTYNSECWEVIENGVKYYFGMNKLPGWAAGDQTTNSAWTMPVYCAKPGVTCSSSTFADSSETEGWRWNLDYVVDLHGNATAYYYTPEQNYYGADMKTTPVVYDRGGHLNRIDYGMTSSTIYAGTAPEQVIFSTAQRCIPGTPAGNTCADSQFTVANAAYWPDVPIDQNCASTGTCDNHSPSFWSRMRLTSITTQVQVNGATQKVDEYDLTQTFPDGGDHAPTLWLASIQHTGWDTTGGGSGSLSTAPLSFGNPLQLPNRVGTLPSLPVMYHDRIQTIDTPTGAQISIAYNPAVCTPSNVPSDPSANTMSCFPVFWTPPGAIAPELDWFQKYTVASVKTQDLHDQNPDGTYPEELTSYVYAPSGMAWHYDDNEVVKAKNRTYGQYRGYAWVETITGDPSVFHYDNNAKVYDQQTMTKTTYFRGMSHNTPGGTGGSTVTLSSADGQYSAEDVNALSGQVFETDTYTSAAGTLDAATVTIPQIIGPTASRARTGLTALTAQMIVPKATYTRQAVSYGWRKTETDTFYNTTLGQPTTGMPVQADDRGEPGAAGDVPVCTWTRYVSNPGEELSLPAETIRADQDCTAAGAAQTGQLISDTRTSYDGNPWTWDGASPAGLQPTAGDITETAQAAGPSGGVSPPSFVVTQDTSYDSYGRTATVTRTPDSTSPSGASLAQTTTTTYTPASGALPTSTTTQKQVTGGSTPTYQTSTVSLDAPRGLATETVNVAGLKTDLTYDPLGQLTAVWEPNESKAANAPANEKFSYQPSQTGPSVVTTSKLMDDGTYAVSETLYNAMLQLRQSQVTDENSTTTVTDYQTDSHDWTVSTNNSYSVGGSPATSLVLPSQNSIPSTTATEYDGMGRADLVSNEHDGTTTAGMTTRTAYAGDTTTVIPPTGGTPATTVVNARGQSTALEQYTSLTLPSPLTISGSSQAGYLVTGGTTNTTAYTYTPAGQQASITGPDSSTWTSTFDLLGRVTSQTDPAAGTTTTSYDDAGNVTSTTDARGKTLNYTYDLLGRKLTETDASNANFTLATWTYDTLQAGQLTSETSYVPGTTGGYTVAATGYTSLGKPAGTKITLPASEAPLPTTGYTSTYSYSVNDQNLISQTDPRIAGLLGETVTYTRDTLGNPITTKSSAQTYVNGVVYTPLGELSQVTYGPSTNPASQTFTYDDQTRQLTDVLTSRTQAPGPAVDNTSYTYDASGNPLSVTDQQTETGGTVTDQQCFAYNSLDQLTQAWTATDNCVNQNPAANPTTVASGPYAYWQSYSYDGIGNRATATDNPVNGATQGTTTTYTNGGTPAAGCQNQNTQPHTLTATSAAGPSGTVTTGFCYDASGNMVSRTPSTGTGQSLQWNDQGEVTSITQGGNTTSFVYDASGNELIRRDPGQTTLFAGDTQITVNTSVTPHVLLGAVRYYTLGGTGNPVAMASSLPSNPGIWYLFNDPLGTATMAMNATTQAVSRQEYTPYGQVITSTSWPDAKRGYLGKSSEPGTGYTDLGARKYDPVLGRFISLDPVLESGSPQQLGGYTYSGDNPVATSDPSGLMVCLDGGPCGSIQAISHYAQVQYNNESQAAENQSINQCGYHMGCVMAQVRAYQSPAYVQAQVQNYEVQQAYIAQEEAAQAAAQYAAQQKAAAARAHSGGGWFSGLFHAVSDVVSFVAPIATLVAVATCAIPGVDVITGSIALGFDLASGALNTYSAVQAFRHGDAVGGALDVIGAALSFAGAGVGGRAVRLAMDARAAQKTLTAATDAVRTARAALPDKVAEYWGALKTQSVARRAFEKAEGLDHKWANLYGGLGGSSLNFEGMKLAYEAQQCAFGCG